MISTSFQAQLNERFRDSVIPPWLLTFNADPEAALHELLRGVAPLGHLSGSEPDELLLDWLRGFGPRSPYTEMLNNALTHWIERHWGEILLPGTYEDATMTAQAWLHAIDTIATSPIEYPRKNIPSPEYPLFGAATRLRERMLADRAFLDNMTEGRSRDPQGCAWIALANHQTDRKLLGEWWRLISLPPDEPWYRGKYGLIGLRRLPPENPAFVGNFNKELAEGLGRLGEALWQRVREGWLPEKGAREEFSSLVYLVAMWSDFPDRWRGYWRHLAARHRNDDFVDWLPISKTKLQKVEQGKGKWAQEPVWKDRVQNLAQMLKQPTTEIIEQADKLLREQRWYADFTGNMDFLVRTACNLSGNIRAANPGQALAWARMAKDADPWDAYAWTNEAMALLAMRELAEALAVYGEAILRFPDNAAARTGRAEVLKSMERFEEALAAYEETIDLFPKDIVARTGRAEVLKSMERFEEALAAYEETKERFPDNAVARTGRAEVLKSMERFEEALAAYEETQKRFPDDVVARIGYEGVLRALQQGSTANTKEEFPISQRKAQIAGPVRPKAGGEIAALPDISEKQAIDHSSVAAGASNLSRDEITLLITDAFLIRRWAREGKENDPWLNTGIQRERARVLLKKLSREEARDPLAAGESGILSLATGEAEDRRRALDLLRAAARRFPGSPRVRYALARAEREEAIATGDAAAMKMRQWKTLVRLDRHLLPLQWLGPILFLARSSAQESEFRKNVEGLQNWLSPRHQAEHTDPSFHVWWGSAVYSLLFGAMGYASCEFPDLEHVRENVHVGYRELVTKEEEIIYRHARR
uniref:Tetratricopeptide repeat-containing protein n=1 Tax=Candidatus Kentrum sp. UNK TaxID=2126344 RepID=A0A451AX07_9GAMM|nr:MAG: Tetratricopeptide repeat-containing protein [Candidatus Kentron sp. UNK]VFK70579.1 MAG: Tetratricopeptide repeat-containing protein [Candidatus Kentron sp. UNK]